MLVKVYKSGSHIWSYGNGQGVACKGYLKDGTQLNIIKSLEMALEQARVELACCNDADRVSDVCTSTAKV